MRVRDYDGNFTKTSFVYDGLDRVFQEAGPARQVEVLWL
jgi:hypothetical protein